MLVSTLNWLNEITGDYTEIKQQADGGKQCVVNPTIQEISFCAISVKSMVHNPLTFDGYKGGHSQHTSLLLCHPLIQSNPEHYFTHYLPDTNS